MIQSYSFKATHVKELNSNELKAHISDTVWVNLFNPTVEEEALIEGRLGINIPTRDEMQKIELSSRLYQYKKTIFATISLVTVKAPHPESHPVTFVLHNRWLITISYGEGNFYNRFIEKAKLNHTPFQDVSVIVNSLLEEITEQLADILENTTHLIEEINR